LSETSADSILREKGSPLRLLFFAQEHSQSPRYSANKVESLTRKTQQIK